MRHFTRSLARHPASSVAAAVMGAIGIALLALAVAVVDATLWRSLPFPRARDALVLYTSYASPRETRPRVAWSFPRLQYVRERATTIDHVTAWRPASVTLTGRDEPQVINGEFVSRDYFDLLGVVPVVGRTFAADEDVAGAPRLVALVSASFRSRRAMAGDPVDLGSTLRLNGQLVTVVGVLPAEFRGLTDAAEFWLPTPVAPVLTYPEYLTTNQDFITLLARRKAEHSLDAVRREVAALAVAAHRSSPSDEAAPDLTVSGTATSLGMARVRPEGRLAAILALAGAVVLFLLSAANLVGLLLARVVARRRETAVTLAIGATPARVWRAHLTDGVAVIAVAAGLALGGLALWFHLVGPIDPLAGIGRSFFATFTSVAFDWRFVGWWLTATILGASLVATVPAWWAVRHADLDHLREGSHGSAATGVSWRRPGVAAAILTIEGALAVVLVAAAGQFLESYRRMQRASVGVDPTNVLTFELQPAESDVPTARAAAFVDRVLDAVREVPGVQSASVDGGAPLAGSASSRLHVVGRAHDARTGPPLVLRHYVGPEHFATLGVPLRAGRIFTDADRADAPRVVVISESAARQFFPAGDAIGQRVWFDGSTLTSPDSSGEIVGIVGDVKYDPPLGERTMASFYTPYRQFTYGWRVYFVKLARDAQAARPAIAEAVRRAAPGLPMRNVRALEDIVSASRAAPKRAASGTSVLALLGLALAVGGIWALVSHATAQRTRDLAIRMAHGATAAGVVRLVLRDGLAWPVAGLVAGTVITLASSGVLRAALYGVAPGDPRVVTVGAVVCLLSAVGACLGPAWRAAQGDPITVLRSD